MPRRLLRDRRIVEDEWQYFSEAAGSSDAALIVTFDQWQSDPGAWVAREPSLRPGRTDLGGFVAGSVRVDSR